MRWFLLAAWCAVSAISAPVLSAQQPGRKAPTRGDIALPPMSWTCPMHPEIVDDKDGACPICKMALVPVRLELDWSCPVHTAVIQTKSGRCPICRRQLVQVTAAVSWTCVGHPEVKELNPGTCRIDGTPLIAQRERRPHGDHNPRHGGVFFMASDNTHHLEGTYPRDGVFRVFVYDEYTRALPLTGIVARAVTKEAFDRQANVAREIDAVPLRPSRDGKYLEARLGSPGAALTLPVQVTAKVRFTPGGAEQRFDFSFQSLTNEPAPPGLVNRAPSQSTPMTTGPATQPVPDAPPISTTMPALLASLTTQSSQVRTLLEKGAYTDMYYPALAAKEAAIALDEHTRDLPEDRRAAASDAVRRVVLGAWLIDLYGDIGNKLKLTEAYDTFAAAVADVKATYGQSGQSR